MEFGKFNSDVSLTKMGITLLKSVHYNLNEAALMQHAIQRGEGVLLFLGFGVDVLVVLLKLVDNVQFFCHSV